MPPPTFARDIHGFPAQYVSGFRLRRTNPRFNFFTDGTNFFVKSSSPDSERIGDAVDVIEPRSD